MSTDIAEIVNYCIEKKIDHITRDSAICRDESRIEDVLDDAIEKKGKGCDCCSLVYGNIPTRYPRLFHEAKAFLELRRDYDAVLSMQNVEKFHPEWMLDLDEEFLPMKKVISYQRQGLSQKMIHDGHTVLFRSDGFHKRYKGLVRYEDDCMYSIFGSKIKPLINMEAIVDIDTEKDLRIAESLIAGSHAPTVNLKAAE